MSKSSKKIIVSKSSTKSSAKKVAAKKVAKKATTINARTPTKLQEMLIKLFTRKGGCTMHDTYNAGYAYPAATALKMMERRGYKVSSKKEPGELKVYSARK